MGDPVITPQQFLEGVIARVHAGSFKSALASYKELEADVPEVWGAIQKLLCQKDLFFLLCFMLRRPDAINQWCYDRCREVQMNPDGYLDLWSREFYKSTIISFALTIQDILNNPELTIAIFSQTRPAAKKVLRQIKQEFEENKKLQATFPEILWVNPQREAPKWSLAIDTPVLTVNGWKAHGDLQVGDKIFGSRGQVVTVIGTSGTMLDVDCRRVKFDDCEIVASVEHLWPVQCKKSTGGKWSTGSEVAILQTDSLPVGGRTKRLFPTPSVKMPENAIPLALDPYILGLFLGDGTAGTNIISMAIEDEEDVLCQIKTAGFDCYVHRKKVEDNFSMYGIKGLKEILLLLGCLSKKHIPHRYLLGTESERLSLLQGLMDSDGTCKKDSSSRCAGMCMFSNTNYDLVRGVLYLATSLGLRPSMVSHMPKQRGKLRIYQVYFVGLKSIPPFRSPRKLARCKDRRHKVGRYVRSIDKVESVPVNCIRVDAPDHLYLAGFSMVPTHNSEDDGIVVRRKGNPKEATIEAWGLVDGQPAGPHWDLIVYDDVVTKTSVTTSEMIEKTNEMWELSLPLSKVGGRRRYAGTYYHHRDTYKLIEERGAATIRKYPATKNGKEGGEPVFMSREELDKRRREWGQVTYATQMLLDPSADNLLGFKKGWLKFWPAEVFSGLNLIVLCDPAGTKKKASGHSPDYTVFILLGYGADRNWYVCDMVRDRLSLTERADVLFTWHRDYHPMFVGYEKYGKDSDIEHYTDRMNRENYRFEIQELGGNIQKTERIGSLIPLFEQGRIYLPDSKYYTDADGKERDLVQDFINDEYLAYPIAKHDDMLDCLARLNNPAVPKIAANSASEAFEPNRRGLASTNSRFRSVGGWRPRRSLVR